MRLMNPRRYANQRYSVTHMMGMDQVAPISGQQRGRRQDLPQNIVEEGSGSQDEIAQVAIKHRNQIDAQKHILEDKFKRKHTYLRISLTEKCNLRCRYCMPLEGIPSLPRSSVLSAEEIGRLARLFVSQGVDKIRLTGGEPTLRKDLAQIMSTLHDLKGNNANGPSLKQIGITTNGLLLTRLLPELLQNGLSHLNVSLDTLNPHKFELITRRPAAGLQKVLRGVEMALHTGVSNVKMNVVVLRGLNDTEDVYDFIEWAKDKPITLRFIEYMPFDGNKWKDSKLVPYSELLFKMASRYGDLERCLDDKNDTTKHYRIPGHHSKIGFITSMSQHFCSTCNRIRITADGNIKVCLFGNTEVSLRDAMRSGSKHNGGVPFTDEEMLELIGSALWQKHASHGGLKSLQELARSSAKNRSMIQIGG